MTIFHFAKTNSRKHREKICIVLPMLFGKITSDWSELAPRFGFKSEISFYFVDQFVLHVTNRIFLFYWWKLKKISDKNNLHPAERLLILLYLPTNRVKHG